MAKLNDEKRVAQERIGALQLELWGSIGVDGADVNAKVLVDGNGHEWVHYRLAVPAFIKKIILFRNGGDVMIMSRNTLLSKAVRIMLCEQQPPVPDDYEPVKEAYYKRVGMDVKSDWKPTEHYVNLKCTKELYRQLVFGKNWMAIDKMLVDLLDMTCWNYFQAFLIGVKVQGGSYRNGVKLFLDMCGICDDEYEFLTAHQRWQRVRSYQMQGKASK